MRFNKLFQMFAVAAAVSSLHAQNYGQQQAQSRQATMRGGGNSSEGKCTVEVVVDGAAQLEIRGASAQLVNLKGQPPQWRRFDCTSAMPANPQGFRFAGVDGRGSQQLVREPRNGSPAVIEINDPDNGSEAYTFDITWSARGYGQGAYNQGGYNQGGNNQGGYNQDGYNQGQGYPQQQDNRQGYGRNRANFSVDQAVSVCQDNIRQQAANRFRTNNIQFRQTTIDDNPGRGDWVIGIVDVRVPRQQDQAMRFSCSVNFMNGQVRSATIEPVYSQRGQDYPPQGSQGANGRAIQSCERAAQQRVVSEGFDHVTMGTSRVENGNGFRVVGDLRAYGRYGSQSFRYSCTVDPRDGDLQGVEVFQRDEGR